MSKDKKPKRVKITTTAKISSTYDVGNGITITAPEPLRNLRQGEFLIRRTAEDEYDSTIILTGEQLNTIKKIISSLEELEAETVEDPIAV